MNIAPLPAGVGQTATPPAIGKQMTSAAAQAAAQKFEAFFLQQSFENMFEGTGNDSLFGGGQGEAIYRSLLLQEYSKVAAESGGIGIAAAVRREILSHQEVK